MFQTIVVPLDGSLFAEQALPLAASVARHCGSTLRLLRVVPPLSDYFFMPPEMNDPLDRQLRQRYQGDAREYLTNLADQLKGQTQVICDVMEEEDDVSESICNHVVRSGADLIVLSSHGRGAVARFWLGSIADRLVRTAPVPVFMARPPENPPPADAREDVPLKHILIALGGSTDAGAVVRPALTLGKCTKAEYTLVRVVRPAYPSLLSPAAAYSDVKVPAGWSALGRTDEQNCAKAEEYLEKVAIPLRAEGAAVTTRVHIAEQPATAILREAALVGADAIALETHGRGASRLLIGSVADKIVRGSTIPVLVCRLPTQTA